MVSLSEACWKGIKRSRNLLSSCAAESRAGSSGSTNQRRRWRGEQQQQQQRKENQTGKKKQEHAAGEGKGEFCFSQKKGKGRGGKHFFFKCGISRSSVFESNVRLDFDKCWGGKKVDVAQE